MTPTNQLIIFTVLSLLAITITAGCTDTSRSADEWYYYGNTLLESGNYTEAIEAYDKALAQNPDAWYAWNNRGSAYFHRDKYDDAIQSFNRTL